MLAPLGVSQLILAFWLLTKGFRDPELGPSGGQLGGARPVAPSGESLADPTPLVNSPTPISGKRRRWKALATGTLRLRIAWNGVRRFVQTQPGTINKDTNHEQHRLYRRLDRHHRRDPVVLRTALVA
jgi:hypothetical protein